MTLQEESLALHLKHKGKLQTLVSTSIKDKTDLSLVYTPGVGEVSRVISEDKEKVYNYTIKSHTVGIVTDGSAVLGLGNIGPEAALPVMEGKAALLKNFANVDAFPICLDTQETNEIISIVKNIAPVFGGINLEDISAPRCFEIEEALQNIGIPVMHDDQHGTAVVVLAGLLNAAKVANKDLKKMKVVISGAGAAGHAIADFILENVDDVIILDSKGIINKARKDLDIYKQKLSQVTNKNNVSGSLKDAIKGSDIFIGVSKPGIFLPEYVKLMSDKPIIFALANPVPEIMPDEANNAGAFIVATGRSDFNNQINNSLAFPGIFKGALEGRAVKITKEMKLAAAYAISSLVSNPSIEKIIPDPFEKGLVEAVSKAVMDAIL